jgi:hypothetical protein
VFLIYVAVFCSSGCNEPALIAAVEDRSGTIAWEQPLDDGANLEYRVDANGLPGLELAFGLETIEPITSLAELDFSVILTAGDSWSEAYQANVERFFDETSEGGRSPIIWIALPRPVEAGDAISPISLEMSVSSDDETAYVRSALRGLLACPDQGCD